MQSREAHQPPLPTEHSEISGISMDSTKYKSKRQILIFFKGSLSSGKLVFKVRRAVYFTFLRAITGEVGNQAELESCTRYEASPLSALVSSSRQ